MNNTQFKIGLILLLLISTATHSFSQERSLQVTNSNTGKTFIIKDNKRVKLRTTDGNYMVGKMQILENNQVSVKGQAIELNDILKIKRSPWIVSALSSGGTVYLGGVLFGIGTIVAIFGGPQPILLMATGGILVYAGLKPPQYAKNAGPTSDLQLEIISN